MRKLNLLLIVIFLLNPDLRAQSRRITGFTDSSSASEYSTESAFDRSISAKHIGLSIRELSAKPHHLGSPGSREVADKIMQRFQQYGFETHLDIYQVLFPTPKKRILEMSSPTIYRALLKEAVLKEDATSGQEGQLPTYNAWSDDGNVTAPLVFVNYGLPADYDELVKMGIDVKGKIVIVKYGMSWRGIKPKVALEHGAIGCIIYSDPKDDGYFQGDVYPRGPFKNEYGVQRGSVMDMPIYPGDPLTPGIGATKNAKRIASHNDAPNLLKIPVLPISYHDAKPLLEALEGPVAPESWRGALPITYHVGPGKTTVHLQLEFDWKLVPCYDVIATLKGKDFPDEWVIRGNHHDAWVNGAQDPISGQASMLEEAKAVGELVKTGWKPRRTLVYCAWDGEEPALLGSTEWAEDHDSVLKQKAVLYINSDGNGRGFLYAGGSHSLEGFVDEVAKGINDPETGVNVYERQKAQQIATAPDLKRAKEDMAKTSLSLDALGSGSDFSAFLQHLGVPSLNIGYGGEDNGGEYHSIYDSYDNFIRFKDPGFPYEAVLAKTAGHLSLRMADADLLPFDFRSLYSKIRTYSAELQTILNNLRENTEISNEVLKGKYLTLASDTAKPFFAPKPKEEVPYIDFSPLQNAVAKLEKGVEHAHEIWERAERNREDHDHLNQLLYRAEQQLLLESGLPERSWYKHVLYAPGMYTGYGVKTMPGIREAIEQRDFKRANEEIKRTAAALEKLGKYLEEL
ncbi:MAG: transferrin receptor-like dimerization domain-containing protein [Bacteroidota bacterium]|nr:transferrin receptor-like dimerization domain-containing protein [Bacteroidota bacterium]